MKFEGATESAAGYECVGVVFNGAASAYLGRVRDPRFHDELMSCTWNKRGQCRNRTRPDCDLKLPTTKLGAGK